MKRWLTEHEQETITGVQIQFPQEGMSTFDRNHLVMRHEPERIDEQCIELKRSLRERAPAIEAGDRRTASMLIDAAVAIERLLFQVRHWRHIARDTQVHKEEKTNG